MSKNRPLYTPGDDNHFIPRDFLRDRCGGFEVAPKDVRGSSMAYTANYQGYGVLLIDTRNYGGIFPDWYLETRWGSAWIEIKNDDQYSKRDPGVLLAGAVTAGEEWLRDNCKSDFYIIHTEDEFVQVLDSFIP